MARGVICRGVPGSGKKTRITKDRGRSDDKPVSLMRSGDVDSKSTLHPLGNLFASCYPGSWLFTISTLFSRFYGEIREIIDLG